MISGVVYLLRIFKMFHGLMNNPVFMYVRSMYDMYIHLMYTVQGTLRYIHVISDAEVMSLRLLVTQYLHLTLSVESLNMPHLRPVKLSDVARICDISVYNQSLLHVIS